MIGFALAMFGEDFHGDGCVNTDLFQAPLFQNGSRPFFQTASQPAANGHGEAALAPVYDIVGK
jgi:hypothetical protein